MISWIQNTFQKHFRVIFAILLAVTIVSFIFTIGSTPGIGRAERTITKREFFGVNLASQKEATQMLSDARLSASLQMSQEVYDQSSLERYAQIRVSALHVADQLHLPAATESEIKTFIQTLPAFQGENGQFDAARYSAFRQSVLSAGRSNEADIVRVISDDTRATAVEQLLAGPGYALPSDVRNQLELADTRWSVSTATVDIASFRPAITPTEAEISKYFQDNLLRYQIPVKVSVNAVDFPALALFDQVTVTPGEVRQYYDANSARFPAPETKGKPPAKPDANAAFQAVRSKVEVALKVDKARQLALKAASDFEVALYDSKIARGPALGQFIASRGLKVRQIAPFSEDAPPADLGISPQAAESLFHLDSERYYSDALATPAGASVLIWNATIPSRQPILAEVRDKVVADFTSVARNRAFAEVGKAIRAKLEAAVRAGESFDKAAAAAAAFYSVKIETKAFPSFTFRDRPQDLPVQALGTLETLKKGQVSDMTVTEDKGTFVYAAERKAPDLSESNPHYAEARLVLARNAARSAPASELSELAEAELKRTDPSIK